MSVQEERSTGMATVSGTGPVQEWDASSLPQPPQAAPDTAPHFGPNYKGGHPQGTSPGAFHQAPPEVPGPSSPTNDFGPNYKGAATGKASPHAPIRGKARTRENAPASSLASMWSALPRAPLSRKLDVAASWASAKTKERTSGTRARLRGGRRYPRSGNESTEPKA